MTDADLRAWAATQGEAGAAVLRVLGERDAKAESSERWYHMVLAAANAADMLAGTDMASLPALIRKIKADRDEARERLGRLGEALSAIQDALRHIDDLRRASIATVLNVTSEDLGAALEHPYAARSPSMLGPT